MAGTIGGERPQTGIISSDDGKQAASSPDSLSGSDPLQMDVYLQPSALLSSRIQCERRTFANCLPISTGGAVGAPVGDGFDFGGYRLIPGVLHA